MAYRMDMLEGAVRINHPEIHLILRPFAESLPHSLDRPFAVVRMDTTCPVFRIRHSHCGIEAEQAVVFLGRMDDTSARDVVCEATRVTYPLRLRQVILCPLAFGNILADDQDNRPLLH